MCFASSIVESHKKLFIAPTPGIATGSSFTGVSALSIKPTEKSTKVNAEKMSRSKSRLHTEICGDCGAADPSWASINRGILLCDDCCSVHRSLGRHISMIKSLRQGCWEPSVLNFVNSINAHGANSVWEHHLLDVATSVGVSGSTKNNIRHRKPSPKDPLHPTKSDFIKAKHVNLAFVLKPNLQDDDITSSGESFEHELSKQLHASVRTSNLETSLRLLVQGANPNFFHEEKRSTPLHVAAKFGQASQIELLIVYGGDINAIDGNGLTPLEVAKANNHNTIAERLLDALYEVTDRIIMFLGGKKPDHAAGRHLIIPESSMGHISEELKIARGRLQLVPNKMFEELVMDLYDEVDRRENEAIWSTSALSSENVTVPFLPANPFLSATRNQGRQKLARFSHKEFAGLLTDVLIDARRRQNMANLRPMENNTPSLPFYSQTGMTSYNNEHDPYLSDDEPIYDPVASDDDYTMVVPIAQQESHEEMETLRKQLNEYKFEINQLKTVVQKLSSENSELKSKFSNVSQTASNTSVYDEPLRIDLNGSDSNDRESLSLPEVCSGCGGGGSNGTGRDDTINSGGGVGSSVCDTNLSSASSSTTNSNQSTIKRPASMYERRLGPVGKTNDICRTTTSMYQMVADRPFGEEVKHRTDVVTRRLKELILIMQLEAPNGEDLIPCAERIRVAVTELIATFATASNFSEVIKETLKQLTRYNMHVQHECEYLQTAYKTGGEPNIEKFINEMRDCAYYIASATKTLVVQFD